MSLEGEERCTGNKQDAGSVSQDFYDWSLFPRLLFPEKCLSPLFTSRELLKLRMQNRSPKIHSFRQSW